MAGMVLFLVLVLFTALQELGLILGAWCGAAPVHCQTSLATKQVAAHCTRLLTDRFLAL